jgi:hypothetical protein
MQQKGLITMVPHDAEFWAQEGSKTRDQCKRFATNPNFVAVPDDFKYGSGYHPLDDKGDGYKVSAQGHVLFPTVYYIHHHGFAIGCSREYASPKIAKRHCEEGTADILGRRFMWKRNGTMKAYRYFIRKYEVMSSKAHLRAQDSRNTVGGRRMFMTSTVR